MIYKNIIRLTIECLDGVKYLQKGQELWLTEYVKHCAGSVVKNISETDFQDSVNEGIKIYFSLF